MRASLLVILLAIIPAVSLLATGCDRNERQTVDEVVESSAELQGERLVASGGRVELTLEEVERAVQRVRLVAQRNPDGTLPKGEADWIRQAPAQINLVRNLVHFQIVRHEAAERGLEVTPEDEIAFLKSQDNFSRYLPLFEEDADSETVDKLKRELQSFDLTIADVRHLVHDVILNDKLTEVLAEDFSDDQLWALYESARDEAELIVAQLHNTPTSSELDEAVRRLDAEIRAHYRDNRDRFMTPASTRVTLLSADKALDQQSLEPILQQAAERLGTDEDPAEISADLDLALRTNAHISRTENPAAAQADVGDTGFATTGHRGPVAWRVEEHLERQRRPLERPLIREIASELLREKGITPSNLQNARAARAVLQDIESDGPPDEDEIQQVLRRLQSVENARGIHTGFFSIRGGGFIPQLGLSEELKDAVRELTLDDPVTEPILDRNRVLVARLIDRRHPDRETFEEELDEFRAEFIERNKGRFVDQFVTEYQQEHDVEFNPQIVADHFGIDDKKPR